MSSYQVVREMYGIDVLQDVGICLVYAWTMLLLSWAGEYGGRYRPPQKCCYLREFGREGGGLILLIFYISLCNAHIYLAIVPTFTPIPT